MITGEYKNTIDEKGRILIPSRIRSGITGNILIVTRGVEKCLWLFSPEEWSRISASLMDSTSVFQSKTRLLQRRIIAPAQECEIDRMGRINIRQRSGSAGLSKDAVILESSGTLRYGMRPSTKASSGRANWSSRSGGTSRRGSFGIDGGVVEAVHVPFMLKEALEYLVPVSEGPLMVDATCAKGGTARSSFRATPK